MEVLVDATGDDATGEASPAGSAGGTDASTNRHRQYGVDEVGRAEVWSPLAASASAGSVAPASAESSGGTGLAAALWASTIPSDVVSEMRRTVLPTPARARRARARRSRTRSDSNVAPQATASAGAAEAGAAGSGTGAANAGNTRQSGSSSNSSGDEDEDEASREAILHAARHMQAAGGRGSGGGGGGGVGPLRFATRLGRPRRVRGVEASDTAAMAAAAATFSMSTEVRSQWSPSTGAQDASPSAIFAPLAPVTGGSTMSANRVHLSRK